MRPQQMGGEGDPISARLMRQDPFTFTPQFKLTIIGNHRPVLKNVDEAARRRFNMVPFNCKPAVPDRNLEATLRDEWPGILRWMIEGCLDWQANGLIRPATVTAATENYFEDQDLFQQWLDEECDVEKGNRWKKATGAELFGSWTAFTFRAGEKPGSSKSFGAELTKRGFDRIKLGHEKTRAYTGLQLRPLPTTSHGGDD